MKNKHRFSKVGVVYNYLNHNIMTQLILLPKSFRRIALLAFLCTIVGLSFSQCKRETTAPEGNTFKCPIKAVIGNENDILGRWKLMEVSAMSRSDYSCNEIIYDFRQDGSLFVGSNLANYAAQPPGSYFYQLEKKTKGD